MQYCMTELAASGCMMSFQAVLCLCHTGGSQSDLGKLGRKREKQDEPHPVNDRCWLLFGPPFSLPGLAAYGCMTSLQAVLCLYHTGGSQSDLGMFAMFTRF